MAKIIQIRESNELMVDLKRACLGIFIDFWKSRLKKEKTVYLRKSVAEKLNLAKNFLPKNMTFIIGDAWRPKHIQEKILKRFYHKFKRKHPEWSEKRIIKEVNQYAAPAAGNVVSGHMTGGAVDLRICYLDGRKVPLKSHTLSYQENALSNQPELPKYIRKNREIMFNALEKIGLSNVPNEFWHWSFGDIGWARRNKQKYAIYGVVDRIGKEKKWLKQKNRGRRN